MSASQKSAKLVQASQLKRFARLVGLSWMSHLDGLTLGASKMLVQFIFSLNAKN